MPYDPTTKSAGPPPPLAGGRLTIDLSALVANYRLLAERSRPAKAAAVVKADAYGLGIEPVSRALWAAGCRHFFVAMPQEGLTLRSVLPEAHIFVFNGLFGTEAASAYREARLIPVLNSQSDISIWEAHGWDGEQPRPCAIHVDTGMNRLGLTAERAKALAEDNALTGALSPLLVLSHLACTDQPDHAMNRRQLESFQALRALFPQSESSLANSGGIFLGGDFLCDLTRCGIALYGGRPVSGKPNPMRPVVTAEARVAQVRRIAAGEAVSYGATEVTRDTIIAVCSVGYADGYPRSAPTGTPVQVDGAPTRTLGRVAMDTLAVDLTHLPQAGVGSRVLLWGQPELPAERVAEAAGTIAAQLFTSLIARVPLRIAHCAQRDAAKV